MIVSCGRVIFPDPTKAMEMIQTLDHSQRKPVNPLPGQGRNRPARLHPGKTLQQVDRFRPPFEKAVLTTGTVGDDRFIFCLLRDPVQKTVRQGEIQGT